MLWIQMLYVRKEHMQPPATFLFIGKNKSFFFFLFRKKHHHCSDSLYISNWIFSMVI